MALRSYTSLDVKRCPRHAPDVLVKFACHRRGDRKNTLLLPPADSSF